MRGGIPLTRTNIATFVRRLLLSQRTVSTEPHKIKIYSNLIQQIKKEKVNILRFDQTIEKQEKEAVILRHDLDFNEGFENLPRLLTVEEKYDVGSTVYVISDHSKYPLESAWSLLKPFAHETDQIEVGLHTRSHFHENQERYLEREMEEFRSVFGHYPRTVTLHGEYPRPNDYHKRLKKYKSKYDYFENKFSIFFMNSIDYQKISDDNFTSNDFSTRLSVLYRDFLEPMKYLFENSINVINTHPIYWSS